MKFGVYAVVCKLNYSCFKCYFESLFECETG